MRFHITAIIFFLASFTCLALPQNNPYGIDDECFALYEKADELAGKPGFKEANSKLLKMAREKGDTKAETLYYVEDLKNVTRHPKENRNDVLVEQSFERLKNVAQELGYIQYYYYAYNLAEVYFDTVGMRQKAISLAMEMHSHAVEAGDEYGIWDGSRFLASMYIDQDDFVSAKGHLLEALKIYNTTQDETIKRQSPTKLYCDIADTFPVGHDSVGVYVKWGLMRSKTHLDTLRCHYYESKLAILDGNVDLYHSHRDYCLEDPHLDIISKSAPDFFSYIDAILEGGIENKMEGILTLQKVREIKTIANVCEKRDKKDFAFDLEKTLVQKLEERFSQINQEQLSELEVTMGNTSLKADLGEKEGKLLRASRTVTILMGLFLIGLASFFFVYTRALHKGKKKDMQRIAELREAYDQVHKASAAKTRFVQNMSHEVRTPLNAIVGFSQLLALPDGMLSPEEKEQFSGHIVNNSQMLTMLLDDILNASSMDKGEYKITYETGECGEMCRAAISSSEHRLQPGVTMTFKPDFEGEHRITTDPRRVQQILINMLTNACKHTAQGSITLECSLTKKPGMVTFICTDTGTGVPDDQAEKIFDRFTKLNEFVQGSGLGLSICREIAGRMEGNIFLDTSYKEGGARFVFEIPDKAPETPVA